MKKNIFCLNDVKTLLLIFEEEENIFTKLEKYIWESTKICVAVSGGSDSMFCSILIYRYFLMKQYSLDNLYFIHCNHKTRETTKDDQIFVEDFFWKHLKSFVYEWQKQDEKLSEEKMRKWRFEQYQKIIDNKNIDYLILWHNLSDRVESSFLNLLRGAGLSWFLSMWFCNEHHLLQWVKVLRPILDIRKLKIISLCDKYWIPYQTDPTNKNSNYSKRNKLRNNILPKLFELGHWFDSFEKSMWNLYEEIDQNLIFNVKDFKLESIDKSLERNAEWAYELKTKKNNIDSKLLIAVMDELWMKHNITKNFLKELTFFLLNKDSGHKFFWWVSIFVSHSKIYFIKADRDFWKKKKLIIKDLELKNKGFRYPKPGDIYKWKTWNQWCKKENIPVFWRWFLPVLVKDWEIIDIIINDNIRN